MLVKVSSFHVYTHQDTSTDEIENCIVCDLAIENQEVEFLSTSFPSIEPNTIFKSLEKKVVVLNQINTSLYLHFRLFGRPPPAAV